MAYSGNLIDLDDEQSMITTIDDTSSTSKNSTQRSNSHRATAFRNEGVENNLANSTITIVREKCKTLILKLRSSERAYYGFGGLIKPEDDINRIINELGNDLTHTVIEGINSIRDEVKKARPNKDDINYESKIEVYKNLLDYVTNLIKELTKVFDESLTNYRLRVEQLWNYIQSTSDWQQINAYIVEFEKNSEELFSDAVQKHLDPHLTAIESKLNFMKQ